MSEANLIKAPGLPVGDPSIKFPGMRWDPKTGENQTFQSAGDVPEGWIDHHPNDGEQGTPPKAARPAPADKVELPLTRKEIVEHLKAGGVAFTITAGTQALYDLLLASVQGALTEQKIEFDPAETNVVTLLGLFPKE